MYRPDEKYFVNIAPLFFRRQQLRVGDVACLRRGNRYIFALVTKQLHFQKPNLHTIRLCLVALRRCMEEKGLDAIGMPRISCGLDGQNWNEIKALIEQVFVGSNLRIYVYTPS